MSKIIMDEVIFIQHNPIEKRIELYIPSITNPQNPAQPLCIFFDRVGAEEIIDGLRKALILLENDGC